MTRDELIDLVAKVDFEFMGRQNWNAFDKYEDFAKLVAEHEREACAKACESSIVWDLYNPDAFAAKLIRARGEA